MKKLIRFVCVLSLLLLSMTGAAFANADKSAIMEGADITSIHRLALFRPLYVVTNSKAPTLDQLIQIEAESAKVTRMYVMGYPTVADNIQQDKGIDILAIDRRQAAKVFKANVENYADAYVILTVANDSRTSFFFDVYKSGTNELLYTYQIQANRSDDDDAHTYQTFCEQFYKNFDRSITDQQNANAKAEKKAEKAEKAKK